MISYLIGKPILEKDHVVVVVHGVGYGVHVTNQTLSSIAQLSEVELYIYTHVKEEALELYGFLCREDRELFLLLLSVSGVGPKTALAIANIETTQLVHSIQQAEIGVFAGLPRVGKKLAQKIIIDLRSKLGALKELNLAPSTAHYQDVFLALQSLGFSEPSIHRAMQQIDVEKLSLSEAIKQSVKTMGAVTNE